MRGRKGQLELLPGEAPELRRESIALELLDGFQNAKPSAKLRELIRNLGLLQPIIVAGAARAAIGSSTAGAGPRRSRCWPTRASGLRRPGSGRSWLEATTRAAPKPVAG
jgi:hypothetical protein